MPNHPEKNRLSEDPIGVNWVRPTFVAAFRIETQQNQREQPHEERDWNEGERQCFQIPIELIGQQHLIHQDGNDG